MKTYLLIGSLILFLNSCVKLEKETEAPPVGYVKIDMFTNATFQMGLEEKLTNAVIEEFIADGRVKVVDKETDAEAILSGIIKKYERKALSTDRAGLVELYQISIVCELTLENLKTEEEKPQKIEITTFTTYVPKRGHIEYETESEAQERLIEDLASEIVYKILVGK